MFNLSLNLGPTNVIAIVILMQFLPAGFSAGLPIESMLTSKRMASPSATDLSGEDGYADYQSGIRYDEYPVSQNFQSKNFFSFFFFFVYRKSYC